MGRPRHVQSDVAAGLKSLSIRYRFPPCAITYVHTQLYLSPAAQVVLDPDPITLPGLGQPGGVSPRQGEALLTLGLEVSADPGSEGRRL